MEKNITIEIRIDGVPARISGIAANENANTKFNFIQQPKTAKKFTLDDDAWSTLILNVQPRPEMKI